MRARLDELKQRIREEDRFRGFRDHEGKFVYIANELSAAMLDKLEQLARLAASAGPKLCRIVARDPGNNMWWDLSPSQIRDCRVFCNELRSLRRSVELDKAPGGGSMHDARYELFRDFKLRVDDWVRSNATDTGKPDWLVEVVRLALDREVDALEQLAQRLHFARAGDALAAGLAARDVLNFALEDVDEAYGDGRKPSLRGADALVSSAELEAALENFRPDLQRFARQLLGLAAEPGDAPPEARMRM